MGVVPILDHELCYRAVQSRDSRFDGRFITAVRTTGIYCRPSCPARTPKPGNCEFFPTAAAAQQRGYRACKRCRPDASPGSPDWDVRGDVVARAMRLVADGVVEREGVRGLARRLSYSERQLNRLVTAELGAGLLAIARAQRAQTARILIETTAMPLTTIAFAAGFGSVRQFNDTVREVFATSPSALRAGARWASEVRPGNSVELQLPARGPFDADDVLTFLGRRAIPGVEHWDGSAYRRSLALPHGHAVVVLRPGPSSIRADVRLADWRDLAPAVRRVRRLLDLDADPVAVSAVLGDDAVLAPLVAAAPGRRAPGTVDPFETALRAIAGQQISVAGMRTVLGRIAATVGEPLSIADDHLTTVFPDAERVAVAAPDVFPMPLARKRTIVELARGIVDGHVTLDPGADREQVSRQLHAVKGIGPWTAGYVLMRGFGDPDVFLPTDLGVRAGLDRLGVDARHAERWRPWRSYALHHLWALPTADQTRPHAA
jgi:AraC family transcriptional regulator of adaptative response / DNA-3-methyladenine glycosylase II